MSFKGIYNLFPYVVPPSVGVFILIIGINLNGKLSDLLINLSASLITIPLVIFTYERIRDWSMAKANKDVIDYVKMNLDRELLTIIGKLLKLLGVENVNTKNVQRLINFNEKELYKTIESANILRFYLETDWGFYEDNLNRLLSEEIVYQNLNMSEKNLFVKIFRSFRSINRASIPRYYMPTGTKMNNMLVVKGNEVDPKMQFSNRFLLLKKTNSAKKFMVYSFNDLKQLKYTSDLLDLMKINREGAKILSDAIYEFIIQVNKWLDSRGNEFIIDDRNFRFKFLNA